MIDPKLCWYCQKELRQDIEGALFCKECEELEEKKVNRPACENFFDKV